MSDQSKKKIPIWKKALGAVFEFDDESVSQAAANLVTPIPVVQSVPITTLKSTTTGASSPIPNTLADAASVITINNDLKNNIMALIKENNFDGPDYYEFILMIAAMKTIPIISVRYETANAALAAQGMTIPHLKDTACRYKNIIQEDQNQFQTDFAGIFDQEVTKKKESVAAMINEMQELSQRINEINLKIQQTNTEISDSETSLTLKHTQYINAGNAVMADIDTELKNIYEYLEKPKQTPAAV